MEITSAEFRKYAKAHNMYVLVFITERHSGQMVGVAIKEHKRYDGVPLYSFGRLYHVFGDRFTFEQCGCYSTTSEREAIFEAYSFFGFK